MTITIKRVGVIGAGQMGSGIAQVCAAAGYDVSLNDISTDNIESGLATINGNLSRFVTRNKISEDDRKATLGRIKAVPELAMLGACDLIIESAVEDELIKRKIYADLCPHLSENAILATNTSSISITRLAATTDRPEHFMGIHFMNPVPLMELIELVRGNRHR